MSILNKLNLIFFFFTFLTCRIIESNLSEIENLMHISKSINKSEEN